MIALRALTPSTTTLCWLFPVLLSQVFGKMAYTEVRIYMFLNEFMRAVRTHVSFTLCLVLIALENRVNGDFERTPLQYPPTLILPKFP